MTQGPKKDLAHSIRQRLQQRAKTSGRPFQEVFQYFVMERFLYRVSRSRHAVAYLEKARFAMQIDVGFGDVTIPDPLMTEYPTLLELPAPRLKGYSRETVVAEKFEAMTKLGMLNSRMKDFFDLWSLSRQFDFDGATLARAIEATFRHRGTQVIAVPTALTREFAADATKHTQWSAFARKTRLAEAPGDLAAVVHSLATFLSPVAEAVATGSRFNSSWPAPGPWAEARR